MRARPTRLRLIYPRPIDGLLWSRGRRHYCSQGQNFHVGDLVCCRFFNYEAFFSAHVLPDFSQIRGRCSSALRWLPYRSALSKSAWDGGAITGISPDTIVTSSSIFGNPFNSPKYRLIYSGSTRGVTRIPLRDLATSPTLPLLSRIMLVLISARRSRMRSLSGCSRSVLPSVTFPLCQSAVFSAPGRPYNPPPRNPPLRSPCADPPISRGSVWKVVFWLLLLCCCEESPGLHWTAVWPWASNRTGACPIWFDTALLLFFCCEEPLPALNCCLALGLQPNGCIPDFNWNCPATVLLLQILVLPALTCCLAPGFQPTGLMPDLS